MQHIHVQTQPITVTSKLSSAKAQISNAWIDICW
jgi:hypothetical protein